MRFVSGVDFRALEYSVENLRVLAAKENAPLLISDFSMLLVAVAATTRLPKTGVSEDRLADSGNGFGELRETAVALRAAASVAAAFLGVRCAVEVGLLLMCGDYVRMDVP